MRQASQIKRKKKFLLVVNNRAKIATYQFAIILASSSLNGLTSNSADIYQR